MATGAQVVHRCLLAPPVASSAVVFVTSLVWSVGFASLQLSHCFARDSVSLAKFHVIVPPMQAKPESLQHRSCGGDLGVQALNAVPFGGPSALQPPSRPSIQIWSTMKTAQPPWPDVSLTPINVDISCCMIV
ncbi:hypothetical protein BDZ85DRAFT_5265 [Elsinoe ampelina]|uniref:Uncharacterized protein n=1 Tax=Elsinoe ampelina TaxID=302913 RepID=A0A6A6GPD5_9PEZI|nr:hypothetical protein BDZ85DRAFT_5265 [Elsinoe ampelina]